MEHHKQAAESGQIERRYISEGVEYRAKNGDKPAELFGYALRFGSVYKMYDRNLGEFYEQVDSSALDGADMTDVRVLQDHISNLILGRTKSGTAEVGVDNVGLWYRAILPNSPNGENVRVAAERGDIDQSSWGFSLRQNGGDKWEIRDGKKYRTLIQVEKVFDVSPVTFPANPDTSVAKRSCEMSGILASDAVRKTMSPEEQKWIISYLIDNSAWALTRSNDMISALNNWIDRYSQEMEMPEMQSIFSAIVESCKTAKSSLLSLVDEHAKAIQALNGNENRNAFAGEEQSIQLEIEAAILERDFELLK
jgi:HK97 family phage prohead protease